MIKVCKCCGRSFDAAHMNMKYCSYQCRQRAENQAAHQRYIIAKNRRGEKSLDEKVAAADALGVSYGIYVLYQKGVISL